MAKLIIVRHAESEYNCQNRFQGHCDSQLTKRGLKQARELAKRLKNFHIDKIYSSDLGRAYTTTQAISKMLKKPIVKDPLLREIHLGDWEGLTVAEVDARFNNGYQRWLKKPTTCPIPRGEGVKRFRKRIATRIKQIAKKNKGKNVVVMTHGGAITALIAEWLGADFDKLLLHLQIDNTSLTIVDQTKERMRILAVNDTTHLSPKDKLDYTVFRKSDL